MPTQIHWDRETEVVVVGYGLAGAVSAIAANDAGAEVLILEKQNVPGGNSILSGGHVICASDKDAAAQYLEASSGDRVGKDMVEYVALGMTKVHNYLNWLAEQAGANVESHYLAHVCYPFPGRENFRWLSITSESRENQGLAIGPERRGGRRIMQVAFQNVEQRKIEVMLSTAAHRLIQNARGEVIGLITQNKGKELAIRARRAVILACGGFEFNEWLKKQYVEIQPIFGVGCVGNAGDGILMSQKAGAALWHMWLLHGAYGFKFPEFRQGFRIPLGGTLNPEEPARLCWILVNREGKRFMNEALPYVQDSAYRFMQSMNTDYYNTLSGLPEYSNIPCYMLFDESGRVLGPIANPLWLLKEDEYHWSLDNRAEIDRGWIKQANTLQDLAGKIGVVSKTLEQTIMSWNRYCREGRDADFHRISGSMMPIESPPFYAIESWPIVSNTQGGPQFNTECQVVDPYGEPIPRLYKAGELGSFYGYLYTGASNLAECIIEGRTAGENAAMEKLL